MRPPSPRLPSLLALLALGCERYPEDPVFVYGVVQRVDGSPLAGAPLGVDTVVDTYVPGEPRPPPPFTPYRTTTTEAEGAFTLEVRAGDVGSFSPDNPYLTRFRVATPLEEDRGAFLSFTFNAQDVELPPLRPWAAHLEVSADASQPTVTFAPAPPAPETPPNAALPVYHDGSTGQETRVPPSTPEPVLQLTHGGALLWQEVGARSPWSPSPWVLEDFTELTVQVRALSLGEWWFAPLAGTLSSVSFRLEWRSERRALPASGARRPLSRGAACPPVSESACPWTDGKLAPVSLLKLGTDATQVGVTLAAPASPSRAVVRGLALQSSGVPVQGLVLEGSTDGSSWLQLGQLSPLPVPALTVEDRIIYQGEWWSADSPYGEVPLSISSASLFLEVPLSSPTPVRHVRLRALDRSGEPLLLLALAELSLFE